MKKIIRARTPSLLLREFTLDDAPDVYRLSLEAGMRRWLPDQVYESEEHATEILRFLLEQSEQSRRPSAAPRVLAVCLRASGELVGHVGLSPLDDEVEIGYAVAESHQGRGHATEAVAAMTRWGREAFGLRSVLGIAARANAGSCRVLEKCGFRLANEEAGTWHGRREIVRTYVLDLRGWPVEESAVG